MRGLHPGRAEQCTGTPRQPAAPRWPGQPPEGEHTPKHLGGARSKQVGLFLAPAAAGGQGGDALSAPFQQQFVLWSVAQAAATGAIESLAEPYLSSARH